MKTLLKSIGACLFLIVFTMRAEAIDFYSNQMELRIALSNRISPANSRYKENLQTIVEKRLANKVFICASDSVKKGGFMGLGNSKMNSIQFKPSNFAEGGFVRFFTFGNDWYVLGRLTEGEDLFIEPLNNLKMGDESLEAGELPKSDLEIELHPTLSDTPIVELRNIMEKKATCHSVLSQTEIQKSIYDAFTVNITYIEQRAGSPLSNIELIGMELDHLKVLLQGREKVQSTTERAEREYEIQEFLYKALKVYQAKTKQEAQYSVSSDLSLLLPVASKNQKPFKAYKNERIQIGKKTVNTSIFASFIQEDIEIKLGTFRKSGETFESLENLNFLEMVISYLP